MGTMLVVTQREQEQKEEEVQDPEKHQRAIAESYTEELQQEHQERIMSMSTANVKQTIFSEQDSTTREDSTKCLSVEQWIWYVWEEDVDLKEQPSG